MLQFKDGTTVKGGIEVSTVILNCCEEYNKGYLEGRNNIVAAFAGAMILGGTIGMTSIILANKIIKKINSKNKTDQK